MTHGYIKLSSRYLPHTIPQDADRPNQIAGQQQAEEQTGEQGTDGQQHGGVEHAEQQVAIRWQHAIEQENGDQLAIWQLDLAYRCSHAGELRLLLHHCQCLVPGGERYFATKEIFTLSVDDQRYFALGDTRHLGKVAWGDAWCA